MKEDHAQGLHPFVLSEYNPARHFRNLEAVTCMIVATVGTTSPGAIDRVADVGATSMF